MLRDDLKRYNLGLEHFARLVGVSKYSVLKYEKDEDSLRYDIRVKIERAIEVIRDNDLVAPKWVGKPFDPYWEGLELEKYYREVAKYDSTAIRLMEKVR